MGDKIKLIQSKLIAFGIFLKNDLWRVQLQGLSQSRIFVINLLRVIILSGRGFQESQCLLRASALTYLSTLSIVPIFALAFGIAQGFGLAKNLRETLITRFAGHEDVFTIVFDFAENAINNTKGSVIAGIGLLMLFYTIMMMLNSVEETFNAIWKVKRQRSFVRKFTDYLAIMIFTPIILVVSGSVTVFLHSEFIDITKKTESIFNYIDPIVLFSYDLIPFVLIWLLLTLNYIILPNTHVNFLSSLIAGAATAIMYQVVQWVYIKFQIGVGNYNAIYGSFAALPLFLVWLQTSWIIILFGAEIAYAHQHANKYEFETDALQMNIRSRKLIALLVAQLVIKRFANGEKPFNAEQIAEHLKVPLNFVKIAIDSLEEAEIILEAYEKNNVRIPAYIPARDINSITLQYVLSAIENKGADAQLITFNKEYTVLNDSLQQFSLLCEASPSNQLLKDI
jgi:membrane protein